MKQLLEEIIQIYSQETSNPFPYDDFRKLQYDFAIEFKKFAPNETITADFNTYMKFILGLSSGGIRNSLEDPVERLKTKEWLNKSFYEWFPKYRFLEPFDLSNYKELNKEWNVLDTLRKKLFELIKLKESLQ
ncbi:YxiJ-like family protein [Cohnella mopanensis]|uniref:YxiJ-like family protein n=1 Tax=Cohnella mopanensis TaxID=2911966 RepID=UPI001EF916FD|nr:YxiJ-like family protein [Cohnella mopanensis]